MKSAALYTKTEESLNVATHAFGIILSLIATIFLIKKASHLDSTIAILSVIIYGLSMMILYSASTFYHWTTQHKIKSRFQIFDHASIYILIAGTYTPFAIITLNGTLGWVILAFTWSFALVGVILKIFYTGRFNLLSTIMYVVMGWNIVFAISPLIEKLGQPGFLWLLSGGILYTIGAVLFMIEKLQFNHVIFHVFVLLGSIAHFISIYWYVLN